MVGMVLFLPESWTTRLGLMRQRIVAARVSNCPHRHPDARLGFALRTHPMPFVAQWVTGSARVPASRSARYWQ